MTNKFDWIKKSLLGSSTMPFAPNGGHVHGPHCNHDHGHVHGPNCNHSHDDATDDHVHDEHCNH